MISNSDCEVIVFSNFNVVREVSEQSGSQFFLSTTNYFSQFILDLELTDLPLGGPLFTWSTIDGSKMRKIDRFLVSHGLFDFFLI